MNIICFPIQLQVYSEMLIRLMINKYDHTAIHLTDLFFLLQVKYFSPSFPFNHCRYHLLRVPTHTHTRSDGSYDRCCCPQVHRFVRHDPAIYYLNIYHIVFIVLCLNSAFCCCYAFLLLLVKCAQFKILEVIYTHIRRRKIISLSLDGAAWW